MVSFLGHWHPGVGAGTGECTEKGSDLRTEVEKGELEDLVDLKKSGVMWLCEYGT